MWGPDGNEIYYRRPGELMVAPVQLRRRSDGSGFVLIEDVSGAETVGPGRLFVVFNWLEELKRLVPTN